MTMSSSPPSENEPIAPEVHAALVRSQQLGFLGDRSIDDVVVHARAYVDVLRQFIVSTGDVQVRVVDLGAGGGVPGFIIAHDLPEVHLTMVDRRAKRTDFLSLMVARFGWASRVDVVNADVAALQQRGDVFDAAVARGFGPPAETLRWGVRLVRRGGLVVISEPPTGDRWDAELLAEQGVCRLNPPEQTVAAFRVDGFT